MYSLTTLTRRLSRYGYSHGDFHLLSLRDDIIHTGDRGMADKEEGLREVPPECISAAADSTATASRRSSSRSMRRCSRPDWWGRGAACGTPAHNEHKRTTQDPSFKVRAFHLSSYQLFSSAPL
jgi:hypothetical protein